MGLTGTPIDGRLEEMHSIMDWVAPGLLGSKTRFFQRHVVTDFWGRTTGYKRMDEVKERIQPFFIRRLKKEVLKDLPDKIYENRVVLLSSEERKIYDALAKGGHEATEDAQAIVSLIRCKQFCNYPEMVDGACKKTSKLDALREVLEEVVSLNENKAILFSQYKQMVDILVRLLDDMGLHYLRIDGDTPKRDRAEMQAVFRDDNAIDMMIGTDAMSTGLNLQAASYVVNYDDYWSPSVMSQREDRAHRLGQKEVVTVVNFICRDTIEERIRSVIYNKNKITAQVLGDSTEDAVLRRLGPQEMAKLL
jgi:SNF2 family DNA or RNA helicase